MVDVRFWHLADVDADAQHVVKRQYPASEGATQPRNKGARLERMNLQVQTKTQSRFSATPATPETLGALRPARRLAIQCRKMEREEA